MAKEITAYQSNDGVIHIDKDTADYSDFSGEISVDVGDFLRVEKADDKDGHIKKMLIRWELHKHGDFANWVKHRSFGMELKKLFDAVKAQPAAVQDAIKAEMHKEKAADGVILVCGSELTPKPTDWAARAARRVNEIMAPKPKIPEVAPKVYKKKVAIVGVWPGNQDVIKRQYGEIFDLAIFSADEDKKLHGLQGFHKVFALKKFISHKHIEILRSIGQEPMIIGGAMNELKAALSNYSKA